MQPTGRLGCAMPPDRRRGRSASRSPWRGRPPHRPEPAMPQSGDGGGQRVVGAVLDALVEPNSPHPRDQRRGTSMSCSPASRSCWAKNCPAPQPTRPPRSAPCPAVLPRPTAAGSGTGRPPAGPGQAAALRFRPPPGRRVRRARFSRAAGLARGPGGHPFLTRARTPRPPGSPVGCGRWSPRCRVWAGRTPRAHRLPVGRGFRAPAVPAPRPRAARARA
jgi:hypothetical protein